MVNIGFDCAVAKAAAKLKKIKLFSPRFAYTLGVFKVVFRKIGTPMRIIFDDGEVVERLFTLTSIANGKYCGGGYCAAPYAEMNDGIMDVAAINKISRFTLFGLLRSYKKGTYLEKKRAQKLFIHKRVSHLRMEFSEPLPICIDGEIKGAKNIDFTVIRNAFNFVIPKGSDFKYRKDSK